jgi:hypothetical protein
VPIHLIQLWQVWKNAFFFGAIPVIILGNINAFAMGEEPTPPEFVPYDHLRVRTKVWLGHRMAEGLE